MNPEELQRKLEGAADKVGEEGNAVVDKLKSNKKTFLYAFAAVCVAAVILSYLAG
jgi:hypothetical protein